MKFWRFGIRGIWRLIGRNSDVYRFKCFGFDARRECHVVRYVVAIMVSSLLNLKLELVVVVVEVVVSAVVAEMVIMLILTAALQEPRIATVVVCALESVALSDWIFWLLVSL